MKKFTVTISIILVMTSVFGSVCNADDKKGYVVGSLNDIPDGYANVNFTGEAYCNENDYVTGCSYLLNSYPDEGPGSLSKYSFPVVQPIECSTDKEGFRVCTGCKVVLHGTTNLATQVSFYVYAFCGRTKH